MALFLRIEDDELDTALDRLAGRQIPRTSKSALSQAILWQAVQAALGDPQAWRRTDAVRPPEAAVADRAAP